MHVATKRLYGHAHFSYSCMHVATKRLYGPAIFSRQDAVVIHASVQTSLIREAPACRHRPSAIVHQKLLFLFTCFIRFCNCFMHVLCAFIFVFLLVSCMSGVLLSTFFHHGFSLAMGGGVTEVLVIFATSCVRIRAIARSPCQSDLFFSNHFMASFFAFSFVL